MKKFPNEITIDPEFAGLIPAISEKEFAQLEKNILEDGLREPLTVWADGRKHCLIDGHNRLKIWNKHRLGREVPVRFIFPANREAALLWIEENQAGRRNLTDDQRAVIWDRIAERRSRIARAEGAAKARAAKADPSVSAKTAKSEKRDTRKAVAREARLSEKKLRAVRELRRKDPALAEKVRKGEITLREAMRMMRGKPAEFLPGLKVGDTLLAQHDRLFVVTEVTPSGILADGLYECKDEHAHFNARTGRRIGWSGGSDILRVATKKDLEQLVPEKEREVERQKAVAAFNDRLSEKGYTAHCSLDLMGELYGLVIDELSSEQLGAIIEFLPRARSRARN